MMKQLLQANITFFFFSEANLLVSCLSPWQGKNKKKNPRYEKRQAVSVFYQRVCREVISCT